MIYFNTNEVIKDILTGLETYKNDEPCKGVVLGLSGGKDSTTVAMLAKKVWGDNVLALIIPNGDQKDLSDAKDIAEKLNINYNIINIETIYNSLIHNIEYKLIDVEKTNSFGEKLYEKEYSHNCPPVTDKAKTNIAPRIRMIILYAIAQSLGYRVIGTGNLSESYIGWCTKFGDTAYDINPIGNYTCTEVIAIGLELAKEFNLDPKYIIKAPADGITGKSDEENFGFTYPDLDSYIKNYSDSYNVGGIIIPSCLELDNELKNKINKLYISSEHKREMPLKLLPIR